MPSNTEMHDRAGSPTAGDDADPASWSASRVQAWLESIDMHQYAPCFAKNHIQGKVLALLTEDHLREIGVESVGHRVLLFEKCTRSAARRCTR